MQRWCTEAKVDINDAYTLSLVYTPGVGQCCIEIKDDNRKSLELTNKANSIAVVAYEGLDLSIIEQKLITHKQKNNIDAYPVIIKTKDPIKTVNVIKMIAPTFSGFDLSLIDEEIKEFLYGFDLPLIYDEAQKINLKRQKEIIEIPAKVENMTVGELSVEFHQNSKGVMKTGIEQGSKPFKENLVAVITDGSAVLGFGNIGTDAALPVMEGKCALLKSLGGVDAMSLCLDTQDTEEIIDIVSNITGGLGGVNLEDISAPRCFEIEKRLKEICDIPIFHDDQHGTAIICLAGIINALKLVDKKLDKVKIAISGAGAAAQAVAKLLIEYGAKNVVLSDSKGIIYKGRLQNDEYLEQMAQITNPDNIKGNLEELIKDADVFIGLSKGGIVSQQMIKSMSQKPIVFALANPVPEIMPDLAKQAGAYIIATGRSDFENQINNSLAFPGIFRGALDAKAKQITDEMKLAAAQAIAGLMSEDEITPANILPNALDKRVVEAVANAVREKVKAE